MVKVCYHYKTRDGAYFLMLLAQVLLEFQGGLLNAGFWASGHYPQSMLLYSLSQLLKFSGTALPVILGGGPVQAASGLLIGTVVGFCLRYVLQRKISPWLHFGIHHVSFSEIRRLIAPSFASLAFPLGVALNIQGVRLVIGLVLGPAAVAIYVPIRTISNFVVQPRQVVNQLTEPEMAMAFGAENKSLYQKLFLHSVRISFWSCLSVSILLLPASKWIYPIWTAGKVGMDWPTFILLLLAAVINSIWYTALMVPYSTNRHGVSAVYYLLIYGLVFFGLSYFATKYLGIAGPPGVLILVESIMAFLVVKQALRLTDITLRRSLSYFINPPIKECLSVLSYIIKKISHITIPSPKIG